MAAKTIYLLRHGDTGRKGRYIGSTDVALSRDGLKQVRKTAQILKKNTINHIYCSPLTRCRQTCNELQLGIPCQVLDTLKEIDFGEWEGKTFAEIHAADAEAVAVWASYREDFCFPGGECLSVFRDRLLSIAKAIDEDRNENILLITHGGVIRHLLCLWLDIPLEKYLLFDVQPGSYSSLALYSAGGVLTGLNIRG